MRVTDHFKYRFVQRILGIRRRKDIMLYLALNNQNVTMNCLKLFEYSDYIGQRNVSGIMYKKYYKRGNLLLVTDYKNEALITIIKNER